MATQQIRNIINNQIDSRLARAEKDVRNEGKKRLKDLKKKIPTPQEVQAKMTIEIDNESCSEAGYEEFMKKYNEQMSKFQNLEFILDRGLNKFDGIINKVKPISEEKGPIKIIMGVVDYLSPIIEILKIIISLAPIALIANSGPTSSGAVTDQIQDKRDKANGKIKEWAALFATIPAIILLYKNKAEKILSKLELARNKLNFLKEKILLLKALLDHQKLEYVQRCNDLNNPQVTTDTTVGIDGEEINPDIQNTDLENYLQLLQQKYNSVYQQLQESGDTKALERTYNIKENLQEFYNSGFKIINPQD